MECIFIFLVENLRSPESMTDKNHIKFYHPKIIDLDSTLTCVMQLEISVLEMVFDCTRPKVLNQLILYA